MSNKNVIMKKIMFLIILSLTAYISSLAQGYNDEKVSLSNFLKRMYTSNPFEGVKVVQDYDANYLISVVSLERAKYNNQSIMNRVAQTKAQSQASRFFNGSQITSDFIIRTTETKTKGSTNTTIETMESIRENSIGFVNEIELLTNFENSDSNRMVFIYYREIESEKK